VLNAVASLAVASHLGVAASPLLQGLASFPGVGRRLQLHGDYFYNDRSISIFEDYGHHPAEIAVTIATLRQAWPQRRLVVVFQPHRYSRTQQLLDEFAAVLAQVDVLLLLDIYAAGEAAIDGVSSTLLAETIHSHHELQPIMVHDGDRLINALQGHMAPGDLIVFQGAGSVGQMAKDLSLEFA
jgi:UDP-N-acetylmuramate--alanine ligase